MFRRVNHDSIELADAIYSGQILESLHTFWPLIKRLLFPEPRRWVARVCVLLGLSMVVAKPWEPYLDALFERWFDLRLDRSSSGMTGWILFLIGLAMILLDWHISHRTRVIEAKITDAPASAEANADGKTLVSLFKRMHLPTMQKFFDKGKDSRLYLPVEHYQLSLEEFVASPSFYVHDPAMRSQVQNLIASLQSAMAQSDFFVEMPDPKIRKFDSSRDIYVDPEASQAFQAFKAAIWQGDESLRRLCRLVKEKYPDFDFAATDACALADYKTHNTEDAPISVQEFRVLRALVDADATDARPSVTELARSLHTERIVVQAAIDSLIRLDYVKHIYSGGPAECFVVLKNGRAHYMKHRDKKNEGSRV